MQKLFDLVDVDSPDWNQIQQLVRSDKSLITKVIDSLGPYLLHYACWKNAPSEFVIQLIHDYPKACEVKDSEGLLPLHIACRYNQSESVIQLLITKYPKACQEKNNNGCLPLHYACQFNQSESVIQLLINDYPKACQEKNNDGWYALHYACAYNQSESVIQLLITKYPKACEEKNNNGWLPLHDACRYNKSESVIQLLITKYPEACEEKNYFGLLPLHCACAGNASLSVIQLVVHQWPDALTKTDNNNRTPLDWARAPDESKCPNNETISWLENYDLDLFVLDRSKLRETIEQRKQQAIVSEQYIQSILNINEILGAGYFGKVFLGHDTKLNNKFAIKTINTEILASNGGVPSVENIQKITNTFHKEQQVLMHFNHPNITMLLAYSFPTTNQIMGNYYLIYEYAERGSLDGFWKDDTGREQLNFRRRVIIAYEIMTALRFLHEGNDKFTSCCHRDIKSANIVLKNNLSAQLIDCGLAKFVTDDNSIVSSAGVKGTPGYICPEYLESGEGYEAACDIFSYGVVLTELFTGKLQNQKTSSRSVFNFSREYVRNRNPRSLVNDIDKLAGYADLSNLPTFVNDFANLALDCMSQDIVDRPEGLEIMNRLKKILDDIHAGSNNTSYCPDTESTVDDSIEQHELLCHRCRTYKMYLDHTICHMCFMVDKLNIIEKKVDEVLVKLDVILPMLIGLDAKFTKEIPRLFVFYPANLKSFWKNPKSWIRSQVVDTYHLQFVCAHSFRAIHPPIKVRTVKGWMEKFAPVLAVSLFLMSKALEGAVNVRIDVTDVTKALFKIGKEQIRELLTNVYTILDECTTMDLKACLEANNFVTILNSRAYDEVKKLALEQKEWQENMVLVKKPASAATLWVEKSIAFNECNGYEVVNV